jgi:putative transposase
MDNHGVTGFDLNKYTAELAKEFEWAGKLNSMARQASAERAWFAISRFYDNCKKKKPGKKGYPKFKKHSSNLSVEYKTSGWKLSEDRRQITFSDGFEAGTFEMWGTRDLHFYGGNGCQSTLSADSAYQIKQIKRVRVVRRADGYYVQFCIDTERNEKHEVVGFQVGIDVGLNHFYTDSDGTQIENPRFFRKDEKALKKAQRRLARSKKGSKNRSKARNRLGRKHLKVSRQGHSRAGVPPVERSGRGVKILR